MPLGASPTSLRTYVAPGGYDPLWVTLAESDLALSVQLKKSFTARSGRSTADGRDERHQVSRNSHHVDYNVWACGHRARPVVVRGSPATGVAYSQNIPTEDTITLTVDWVNNNSGNRATAIYTSSWIAPRSDVHSQQRFHMMAHGGEITVAKAHLRTNDQKWVETRLSIWPERKRRLSSS